MMRDRWSRAGAMAVAAAFTFAAQLLAQPAYAAARLPFVSDFESGTFTDWDGGPTPTMSIVTGNAASGQRSVQSVLTPGTPTDSYQDFYFGDHANVAGAPVTPAAGLWLRLYSKFDTGFQYASSSIMHKIVLVNFDDESPRRRYQVIINVQISTGNYIIEHLKWNADRSFNRSFNCCAQNVGTPVRPRPGQWDKLKLFVRPNTPGELNGEIKLWINDELKVNYTGIQVREDAPYNPNKVILSSYESSGTAAGTQRWDNFYIGETDPDTGPRPMPPVLNEVR
jgi:hypothetical protein